MHRLRVLLGALIEPLLERREARRQQKEAMGIESFRLRQLFAEIFGDLRDWWSRRRESSAKAIDDDFPSDDDDSRDMVFRPRRSGDLWRGMPALLFFLATIIITAVGYNKRLNAGIGYWQRGEQALEQEDFRAAELFLQKAIVSRNVDRGLAMLALARTYEKRGDPQRAAVMLNSLAPDSSVGVPEAHLFRALRIAKRMVAGETIDFDQWKWHIDQAKSQDDITLSKLRADYFMATGDFDSSIENAEKAAEQQPLLWLQIAVLQRDRNQPEKAEHSLARALRVFETRYQENPESPDNVVGFAQSLLMSGAYEKSRDVLILAMNSHSSPQYAPLLAAVYLHLTDVEVNASRESQSTAKMENVAVYLLRAFELAPNDPLVLGYISALSDTEKGMHEAFRNALLDLIAKGEANKYAFFTLGVLEWSAGNVDSAIRHTRQALALDPGMLSASNNLALFLTKANPPDLDLALEIIDKVIATGEPQPDFVDTRAQIYKERGEYNNAITDYLRLLEVVSEKNLIREKLADLYDLTGDHELASRMRDLVRKDEGSLRQ